MECLIPASQASSQFEKLQEGFATAVRRSGGVTIESDYAFAGHAVRSAVAGCELADGFTRPFAHLRITPPPSASPQLRIELWDEDQAGVGLEGPPGFTGELTHISDDGRFLQQWLPGAVLALDRRAGRILGSVRWNGPLGVYLRGKPLARLLAEWYADRGVPVVHAGLVAADDGGVLLAGKGGSGKSTFALACARAGLGFAGEDYAALQFGADGSIVGHSAYNSVFLDPDAARWFPELAPHLMSSDDETEPKSLLVLSNVWPSRLVGRVAIRAVALCRVGTTPGASIRPSSPAEALLALAPSSLLQIHGRRPDRLDRLAQLVGSVPCLHVDLGRDLRQAGVTIERILQQAQRT